ncbi:MAG: GTPase, partial [Planctomycetota bacterium]
MIGPVVAGLAARLGASAGAPRTTGLVRVALVGPPSAGKSSLFNALLGRERTVTDAAPGTTRDAIAEPAELGPGVRVELVDLPGLDAADGSATQRLAEVEADRADLRIVCDEHGRFTESVRKPFVRVRTKADRPASGGHAEAIEVCAPTGAGLDGLRWAVRAAIGQVGAATGLPDSVAAALGDAHIALARAAAMADGPTPPSELVAGELRAALDSLGVVTGRVDPDTVLGLVFSRFCVGK